MALFKKEAEDLPVPQVRALAERGYSEKDIRDILTKKGYNDQEVNITLQRAVAMKVSEPEAQQPAQFSSPTELHHNKEEKGIFSLPKLPGTHHGEPPMPTALPAEANLFSGIGARKEDVGLDSGNVGDTPKFEEPPASEEGYEVDLEPIVEAIIEEKWGEMTSSLDSLREKVEEMETASREGKPENAETEYYRRQLEERMEKLENSLEETSAKLAGIERAFKQFIPSLTNNIKALSEAVHRVKNAEVPQE